MGEKLVEIEGSPRPEREKWTRGGGEGSRNGRKPPDLGVKNGPEVGSKQQKWKNTPRPGMKKVVRGGNGFIVSGYLQDIPLFN